MSTPADNLQTAIEELVTSKTLTLEAGNYINRIKTKAAEVEGSNALLTKKLAALETEITGTRHTNEVLRAQVAVLDTREAILAKREAVVAELEKATAVANAKSETWREACGLVFRNVEIRSSMFGQAPAPTSANPNYYPPQNGVPVNENKTSTVA